MQPSFGWCRTVSNSTNCLVIAVIYWPIDWVIRGSIIWNTLPYVLIAAGIPFLFKLTKDNPLDANIGELSYPIYMCHLFVMGLVQWSPLKKCQFGRDISLRSSWSSVLPFYSIDF